MKAEDIRPGMRVLVDLAGWPAGACIDDGKVWDGGDGVPRTRVIMDCNGGGELYRSMVPIADIAPHDDRGACDGCAREASGTDRRAINRGGRLNPSDHTCAINMRRSAS